jgi:hypothetical protein
MLFKNFHKASREIRTIIFSALIFTLIFIFSNTASCLTVTSATLTINADDDFIVYINGAKVFDSAVQPGNTWQSIYTIDVSSYFFCGDYVLAINYYDTLASIVSLTYKLTLHIDDGSTVVLNSDGTNEKQMINGNYLLLTQVFPPGWNNVAYDDSAWAAPIYTCAGSRITDVAYTGGFVPNISAYSGCGVPTAGMSMLVRQKFNVLCPFVNITKSINKNIVTLGETITYCFNYTNTDTAPWIFNIWDTIPAVTDFAGCDHGCTTQTAGSNVIVSWPVTVAPGGSGSVCTWVAANRYPMLKDYHGPCVLPEWNNQRDEKMAKAGLSP